MARSYELTRTTGETDISLRLNLDGEGKADIETGVPFMEHMLDLFAKHGQFDLFVKASGDIEVDAHHTTEDLGICIGQAVKEALGTKEGIKRYGNAFVPMDETLAQVVVDLSNRPHLEFRADFPSQKVGTFDTELVHEFFWKLALEARMNLHIIVHYGHNTHHIIEAIFKACARALDEATAIDPRIKGILSTKGLL
ncbi:imidazoleglycerol-phosphate dehydratase HisB [Shouchella clausii]|jgi:imidazoleglycerol-phosphate dehydratase|uniref:Imidazoleglycerol-phosphate dehydratase n=3 Tax=Shouchella TaxID=2893057 RepID=HIS7_SHOC1|nr:MULTISPECIES: imidazoleglycerol-phosphate dehydratase HisB [Shouchella]Q5WDH9.1 RecName: Full=Imidazoleglycerol-phosphate dehydratase; Short=IGPD [Shouchella clausii KSM-K16]MCM3313545.1 imidazoleglycerol-phosphate dehydratase HisB [Psychrobacillus sp. MER TA 17]ALA54077.1 Imidazoleglycerol-phosphate dehydratase [Shouchella clausii]KKI85405.1 imidazoleglycerol-phosphate dehydratase [Shouchella clausii]MBU3229370.1 imidazoleglycerol-phosphate dehydratase HisB [Shouchella clausii]MBU3265408.